MKSRICWTNGCNIQVESKSTSGLVAEKSFIWFRGRQSCGTIFVEIQKQTKYQVQLQRQFLRLEIRGQKPWQAGLSLHSRRSNRCRLREPVGKCRQSKSPHPERSNCFPNKFSPSYSCFTKKRIQNENRIRSVSASFKIIAHFLQLILK